MHHLVPLRRPSPEETHALSLALKAFRASKQRHRACWEDRNLDDSYITLVEALTWICAIDEQHVAFFGNSYTVARNADESGSIIPGVRWARDRHLHQLPITIDEDPTKFFDGSKGIVSLSAGIRWRKMNELPPVPSNHQNALKSSTYNTRVAGWSTWKSLEFCDRWFEILSEGSNSIL